MMRVIFFSLLIIASFQAEVFGCKCDMAIPEINESYENSDVVFLGQCLKAELISGDGVDFQRANIVRYTFQVFGSWKGISTQKVLTVDTGLGFGDCGFQFNPGLFYIVYGSTFKDHICTDICTRTSMAGFGQDSISKEAQNELDILNLLKNKLSSALN